MLSTDGNHQNFDISNGDFFIAKYDTAGVVNFIAKSGYNENAMNIMPEGTVFEDPSGSIYYVFDEKSYPAAPYARYFHDSLFTNGYDAVLTKMGRVPCDFLTVNVPENNISVQDGIQMFPNPSLGDFYLVFAKPHKKLVVEIYNVLGEKFSESVFSNAVKAEIHLDNALPGIYLVKILADEKQYCRLMSVFSR
jgi:hypothetical protein